MPNCIVLFDILFWQKPTPIADPEESDATPQASPAHAENENLFVNYLSRIHRDEDFALILKGVSRLLNNPLQQTYLPGSAKRIGFHQELLVLFWKICDLNKVRHSFVYVYSGVVSRILLDSSKFLLLELNWAELFAFAQSYHD